MDKVDKWLFRLGCLLPLALIGLSFVAVFISFLFMAE